MTLLLIGKKKEKELSYFTHSNDVQKHARFQ